MFCHETIKRPIVALCWTSCRKALIQFYVQNVEGRVDTYEEYGRNNTISLQLQRSVGFFGTLTVTWQAEPITANILDFSPASGAVAFQNAQQTASINIVIIDDQIPEDMEVNSFLVFYLHLLSLDFFKSKSVKLKKNISCIFVQYSCLNVIESINKYTPCSKNAQCSCKLKIIVFIIVLSILTSFSDLWCETNKRYWRCTTWQCDFCTGWHPEK